MFVRRKKLLHPNKYFRLTAYIPQYKSYNVLVKPPVRALRIKSSRRCWRRTWCMGRHDCSGRPLLPRTTAQICLSVSPTAGKRVASSLLSVLMRCCCVRERDFLTISPVSRSDELMACARNCAHSHGLCHSGETVDCRVTGDF